MARDKAAQGPRHRLGMTGRTCVPNDERVLATDVSDNGPEECKAKPGADMLYLVGESAHRSNGVWGDVSVHSSKRGLLYAFFVWTFFDDSLYFMV